MVLLRHSSGVRSGILGCLWEFDSEEVVEVYLFPICGQAEGQNLRDDKGEYGSFTKEADKWGKMIEIIIIIMEVLQVGELEYTQTHTCNLHLN